jgi:hypothetical protein
MSNWTVNGQLRPSHRADRLCVHLSDVHTATRTTVHTTVTCTTHTALHTTVASSRLALFKPWAGARSRISN